jgi:photosystem II stability/assembly factor-like uncharacterized protein/PKD repeat protein
MRNALLFGLLILLVPGTALPQWSQLTVPSTEDLRSVHYRANGNVWLGAFDTLQWSSNNGNTFIERPTMVGPSPLFGLYLAVHAFDNDTAVITGTMFTGTVEAIYRTTDAGLSWNMVHTADVDLIDILWDFDFSQSPIGYAVGTNGRILRSADMGLNWTPIPSGTTWGLKRVVWAGGSNYLAAGTSAFLRSTNGGLNWSAVSGPTGAEDLVCVGGTCYATNGAQLWRTSDGGASWVLVGPAPGDVLEVLDTSTIIVAGDNGLYRSTTGGQYWDQFLLPGYQRVNRIDFHDAQNGIAVGENGYAIRTSNAGGQSIPLASVASPIGVFCAGDTLTFSNGGDPSYSYAWSVNGVTQSTDYHFTTVFAAPGTYTVALLATNASGSGSATVQMTVGAAPDVAPFAAFAVEDTLCLSSSTTISVPVSQSGVIYRLLRDGVPMGGTLSGGGPLSFPTGSINTPTTFSVIGYRITSCGSDTFEVSVPIAVPYVPPGTAWSFSEAEGCSPYTPIVRVQNSQIGFRYYVNSGPSYLGNGGVLDIPMSEVIGNATVTATVRVSLAGSPCPGVIVQSAQSIQVYQVTSGFYISQDPGNDNQHALVGQQRTITISPVASVIHAWDFGADATPPAYIGAPPPPFSFGAPGLKAVSLLASSPLGICTASVQQTIMVVDSAELSELPRCSETVAGLGAYIADMCLDPYNNRYLTGYWQVGNPMEQSFFAMKLDSAGNEIWRYMGPHSGASQSGSGGSYGYGIAADQEGNAYVTGRFDHEVRQIQGVSIVNPNFLVKFDPLGQLEWQFTSPGAKLKGVQVFGGDSIYVAGYNAWSGATFLQPSGNLHQYTVTPSDPQHGNAFLLALNAQGEVLNFDPFGYTHLVGSPSAMNTIDMNSDPLDSDDRYRCDPLLRKAPDGSLVVAGLMKTPQIGYAAWFDQAALVSHASAPIPQNRRQAFVLRYVPGMGVLSAHAVAGGDLQSIQGVSIATDGGVVLCGRFKSPFIYDGVSVEPQDPASPFPLVNHSYLLRTGADLQPQWHWTGGNRFTVLYDVAIAPDNSIYALAGFTATGVLKGSNGQAIGMGSGTVNSDYAVLHFDSEGGFVAADQGEFGSGTAFNFRQDECGNLHVIALTPAAGWGTEHSWVSCNGCTDNMKLFVIDVGGCSTSCFSAYDPSFRDAALLTLSLSDTNDPTPQVRVTVRNMGQVTANQIVIGYRVNEGPPQYVQWNGSLAYTESIQDFPITSLSYLNRYSNRVVAWIDQVNGAQDDLAANDTLRLTHVMCFEPMHGTYNCGSAGADFLALAEVTQALANCGISSTTLIRIAPGSYHEQVNVRPIPGVTQADTVVFASALNDSASVRLRFAPGSELTYNSVVVLNDSVQGVSFRDMTLENTVQGSGNVIMTYRRWCTDLNVVRCRFVGTPNTSQTCLLGDRGSRRIRIDSCTFEYGSSGIHLFGVNSPSSPTLIDSLTWVRGNVLLNQRIRSMFLDTHVGLVIQDNTIISDDVYNADNYSAIRAYTKGSIPNAFDRNFIRVATTAAPINGGSSPNPYLVLLYYIETSGVRNSVRNNMIFNPLQTTTSVIPTLYCDCKNADFLHNTVRGVAFLAAPAPLSTDSIVVRNNIFMTAASHYALDVPGALTGWVSDNNVFSSGPAGDYTIVFRHQSYNRSLSWWQTNTGLDQGSVQQLPIFVSEDDPHLEPGANFFSCPRLQSVPADIDGDQRGPLITRPGADEGDFNVSLEALAHSASGLVAVPNPSNGNLTLIRPDHDLPRADYVIQDASGRVVHRGRAEAGQRSVPLSLDLAPGAYYLSITGLPQQIALLITRR